MRQCPSCSTVHDNSLELCPHDGETLSPPDPLLGVTLDGKYRVEVLLGHGGMGAVYLGERRDGEIRHRVAIKILRQTIRESEIERRFLDERQILATLQHPNIAAFVEAARG